MNRMFLAGLGWILLVSCVQAQTPAVPQRVDEIAEADKLLREGRVAEALKKLEDACQKYPNLPPPKLLLYRVAVRALPAQAKAYLEDAAATSPDHPEIYLTMGDLAQSESRFSDAILNANKALELCNSQRWSVEQKAQYQRLSRGLLATIYERRQDWPNVKTQLAAWVELEPKNGIARHRLASALFQLNQVEDAIREFQVAAKDEQSLMPANVLIAREYANRNDLTHANEYFQKAVAVEPNSARAHLCYADFLVTRGDVDGAKYQTQTAAQLDPKQLGLRHMEGLVARLAKDYGTAEKIFQQMLNESPSNLNAGIQLALVLAESSDAATRKRALEIAEANFRQDNRRVDVLSTLGYCQFRNGQTQQAQKIFTAILANVKRPPPDVAYFIALILAEDKQASEDAKQVLRAALESPGHFFYRKEAQSLFDKLEKSAPSKKVTDE